MIFSFVKLDVITATGGRQPNIASVATPTYIVFRDGEIVHEFRGAMPKAALVKQILGSLEIEETQ